MSAEGFYGWRVVLLAGLAFGMTAPGQTIGVSVFVDPLIADLEITRSTLSTLYLAATLTGASALPVVGRLIDTWGTRWTMTTVALAFGLALLGASRATGILTLTAAFIGLRMFGQGSLKLTATTSVAFWFERRRGTAVGLTSAGGQGLMSLAPVGLAAVIAAVGWRNTWMLAGAIVLGVHQISILGQRGFDPAQAAAVFVPMTVVGIAATFGIGWLVDRVPARIVILLTATMLGAGMLAVQHVTPGAGVLLYAAAIGISGGGMRNLEGAVIPDVFGTRHLGDLRGTVMVATVTSSAFGPLAIAAGAEGLGSYGAILNVLLAIPAAVIVAALVTRKPRTDTDPP